MPFTATIFVKLLSTHRHCMKIRIGPKVQKIWSELQLRHWVKYAFHCVNVYESHTWLNGVSWRSIPNLTQICPEIWKLLAEIRLRPEVNCDLPLHRVS